MGRFRTAIAALSAATALTACVMPTDDMMNNRYLDIEAAPIPSNQTGFWTGTSGPYMTTLLLHKDGTGLSCSSWQTNNSLSRVKVSEGTIYFQDGARLHISGGGDEIVAKAPYTFSQTINYRPDPALEHAAPYCSTQLQDK